MDNCKKNFVTAIILAAGIGSRMKSSVTKQRLPLLGESVLHRCLRPFEECDVVDAIVVVCRQDEVDFVDGEIFDFKKVVSVVCGGNTRAESDKNGFSAIPEATDYVAIHDAARCLVTTDMIDRVVNAAILHGAATAVKKITDSIKRADGTGFILESVPREDLFAAQTPQVFKKEYYSEGLESCFVDSFITDDNMIMEKIGKRVFCVDCGNENIKITAPDDLLFAEFIIRRRRGDV